ncbi:hypothetical protein ACLEUK_09495 [Pseudescherichia vulneris]
MNAHRKPASRFGFAVLLCHLKSIGFAPDNRTDITVGRFCRQPGGYPASCTQG